MVTGSLRPFCDARNGEGFFERAPGIYVHGDKRAEKAEHYMRFVQLFQDGVFGAVTWEVQVDRSSRVAVPSRYKTDQWVQSLASVALVALWVRACTHSTLLESSEVQEKWDPMMEAHPFEYDQEDEMAEQLKHAHGGDDELAHVMESDHKRSAGAMLVADGEESEPIKQHGRHGEAAEDGRAGQRTANMKGVSRWRP